MEAIDNIDEWCKSMAGKMDRFKAAKKGAVSWLSTYTEFLQEVISYINETRNKLSTIRNYVEKNPIKELLM